MRNAKVDTELEQKNLAKLLWQYSMPAIIATVATSVYNIVDRIFIGQIVGPLAISGLTVTLPLMSVATAFGTLVGSGAASITSIRMGEKRHDDALRTLANALMLNVLIGMAISAIGLLFLDEILMLFGASELTLPYARTFMRIIFIGNPLSQLFFSLNTIMRASGYPAKAMWTVLLTMLVNLVLVVLLVYYMHIGIAGAAWATVIGQVVGLVVVLVHFCNRNSHLHFKLFAFRPQWNIVERILAIGMSPFILHACSCIVVALFNWQLKDYGGDYAIGAYGVINTVVNFVTVVVLGLSQGMQPIVGYNFGAGNLNRVMRTLWMTILVGTVITFIGFLCMTFMPRLIARCFTTDEVLSSLIVSGMRLYTIMFSFIGFQVVVSNFFQSIGMPRISIFLSLSRQIVFLMPLLLILPQKYGLTGIWCSMPVADFLATIVAMVVLRYYYNKLPLENKLKEVPYEDITAY